MNHLILAIIKAKGIPCWMLTTATLHEILATITSKISQTFNLILHGMGLYNVHNNSNAHLVSLINQFLQLFWRTETAGRSKEVADMITE